MFVQAGPVTNVYMPKDRVTNAHQGYAFVEYRAEEDADYVSARDRPGPLFSPAPLVTTVMRKYPRFRTASVDEAQTIYMVEFLRLSRRGGDRAGASRRILALVPNARSAFARPHPDPVASRRANTLDRFAKLTHFSFGLASRRRSRH